MARNMKQPAAAAAAVDKTAEELDVLHPERALVLAGQRVTVREYGHIEWMRLLRTAEPLVASIARMVETGHEANYEEALVVMADHVEQLLPLVAQAADLDEEFVERLDPTSGELLVMTWWAVNGRFFIDRALTRVAVARAERLAAPPASARSTPPSSPTDTSAASSPATPNAS